jgi:hypothetical protein
MTTLTEDDVMALAELSGYIYGLEREDIIERYQQALTLIARIVFDFGTERMRAAGVDVKECKVTFIEIEKGS